MTDVEGLLAKMSKKSGVEVQQLKVEFEEIKANIPPGDKQDDKALRELNKKYVGGKSNAVMKEFIVVGLGDVVDYTAKRRADAIEKYNEDPQNAIESGIVKEIDGNAVAMDDREFLDKNGKYKNRNYGKELLPQNVRQCLALFKKEDDVNYEMATLNLRDKHATGELPPMNVVVKARLNGDTTKGYSTAGGSVTKYETVSVLDSNAIQELLAENCGDHIIQLGDCFDYHKGITEGTPEYYNRFVITPGQVGFFKPAEEGKKSGFMILDDITVDKAVSCYVPRQLSLEPNTGDEINVIAKTSIGKGWDSENKKQTEEDVLQLNVMGIIPS